MELPGWLMFAFLVWIFGYVRSKFGEVEDGATIQIPRWAYLVVCGFPTSEDLAKDTVLVVGLRFQIVGWLLAFCGFIVYELSIDQFSGFVASLVASLMLAKYLVNIIGRNT